MESDYQKELIELLCQNPAGFFLFAHDLLAHLTFINGYAQVLAIELNSANAHALNVEALQEYSNNILKASARATIQLSDLRDEVRNQLSTEGHSHD